MMLRMLKVEQGQKNLRTVRHPSITLFAFDYDHKKFEIYNIDNTEHIQQAEKMRWNQ